MIYRHTNPLFLLFFLTCGGLRGSSPSLGLPGEDEVVDEEGEELLRRGEASGPSSSSKEED